MLNSTCLALLPVWPSKFGAGLLGSGGTGWVEIFGCFDTRGLRFLRFFVGAWNVLQTLLDHVQPKSTTP